MSTPSTPSLADILDSILQAVQTVIYQVSNAIAQNAGVIATVVVTGMLTYVLVRYGTRLFRGVTSIFRAMF